MPELRRYDGADEIPSELEGQIRSMSQAEWLASWDETGGLLFIRIHIRHRTF